MCDTEAGVSNSLASNAHQLGAADCTWLTGSVCISIIIATAAEATPAVVGAAVAVPRRPSVLKSAGAYKKPQIIQLIKQFGLCVAIILSGAW